MPTCSETRVYHTGRVLPVDTNHYDSLFGGKLMYYIDEIASISASKHCRGDCVTASMDSIDFLSSIRQTDALHLESFVTYTGKTSMEVFVKAIAEDFATGDKRVAATSFLTFVALDAERKPRNVPEIFPETKEEKYLNLTAKDRAMERKQRKEKSLKISNYL